MAPDIVTPLVDEDRTCAGYGDCQSAEAAKAPAKRFEPPPYIPDPPRAARSLRNCWRSRRIRWRRNLARPLPPYTPPMTVARNTDAAASGFDAANETAPLPAAPFAEPAPAKRNTNGERSLTRVLGLKLGRVVIDPGHGGHDVGTHGPSGVYEKDMVLDVAKRLGALLEERLGSEVIYTRVRRYLHRAGAADADRQ